MTQLSTTQIAIALAAIVAAAAYLSLVVAPAWRCYGRVWERIAASFLTLYILAMLVGAGAGIGFMIIWTYDQYGN